MLAEKVVKLKSRLVCLIWLYLWGYRTLPGKLETDTGIFFTSIFLLVTKVPRRRMEKQDFVTLVKSMNSALGILQLSELNSLRIFAQSSWRNLHPSLR
jgi:hypothetical protein